jgi:ribosomal protein S18 acetylase RimI-like enzyme
MPRFTIRKANAADDAAAFLALFEPNGEPSIHPRLVIDESEWELWLAESEGLLVGGALMREQPDEAGELRGFEDNLLVDQRLRRRGLARELMVAGDAHFRDRGLVGMQAGGNADDARAIAMFESLGYRIVKRYHRPDRVGKYGTEPGEHRIRMWKDF